MVRDRSSVVREEASRLEHLSEMEFVSRSVALREAIVAHHFGETLNGSYVQLLKRGAPVLLWVGTAARRAPGVRSQRSQRGRFGLESVLALEG